MCYDSLSYPPLIRLFVLSPAARLPCDGHGSEIGALLLHPLDIRAEQEVTSRFILSGRSNGSR